MERAWCTTHSERHKLSEISIVLMTPCFEGFFDVAVLEGYICMSLVTSTSSRGQF